MTDNDIIKALECCEGNSFSKCAECPAGKVYKFCSQEIFKDALDLINRQKAKIEEFADIGKMYSEVKAEAIKEFAKRLKENFPQGDRNNKCPSLYWDDYCYIIDSLVEEKVGEIERGG